MSDFAVLINIINSVIENFNKAGHHIYDSENRDFYIDDIDYCEVDDKLIVRFKEDKDGK